MSSIFNIQLISVVFCISWSEFWGQDHKPVPGDRLGNKGNEKGPVDRLENKSQVCYGIVS